jgi:glycerate 2-kinase
LSRRDRARLRAAARAILEAALDAADPYRLVRRRLALGRDGVRVGGLRHRLARGRIVVIAAGKAALPMARAAEDVLGDRLAAGLAVSTTGSGRLDRIPLRIASHPVPDARGAAAAAEVEALARGLGRDDLLLVLLSGGASALLPAPAAGISLRDKARTTALLLRRGATVHELNAVRKHLSRLKGGGLARAARPARTATLLLSDVVGDDPSTIASGPTVPDATTFAGALAVLRRHALLERVPSAVRERLEKGARGRLRETPKPGDGAFRGNTVEVVGGNRISVEAAAREARRLGLRPLVLTSRLEGEAREVARVLVSLLREHIEGKRPPGPVCLLAGGETTVTVRGDGRGGRNQELVVAAAEALAGFPAPAVVAALATDGIDGSSEAAGGVSDDRTTSRAAALGLAPAAAFLAANDSNGFLGPLGDLIVTGPTGTNVTDVVVLLAGSPPEARL